MLGPFLVPPPGTDQVNETGVTDPLLNARLQTRLTREPLPYCEMQVLAPAGTGVEPELITMPLPLCTVGASVNKAKREPH